MRLEPFRESPHQRCPCVVYGVLVFLFDYLLCCIYVYCYDLIIVFILLCVSYVLVVFARARTKDTHNLPTNIVDFRGFHSSIVLI